MVPADNLEEHEEASDERAYQETEDGQPVEEITHTMTPGACLAARWDRS